MVKINITHIAIFSLLLFGSCLAKHDIKIACIGDSITEGAGLVSQSKNGFPVKLNELLGKGFSVLNCGQSAATMLKMSDYSYWNTNEFSNVFAFNPDVVVIALGTNDSKDFNWDSDRFTQDYQSMIHLLKSSNLNLKIFLCLQPPAFSHAWGINDSTIRNGVNPIIQKIASDNKLVCIDLYTPLRNHPKFFPDSIHLNEVGTNMMAEIIERELQKHKTY